VRLILGMVAVLGLAGQALADAPDRSPVPLKRPGAVAPIVATGSAPERSQHPQRRPRRAVEAAGVTAVANAAANPVASSASPTASAIAASPRPTKRPAVRTHRTATTPVRAGRRGSVCGVNEIKGQVIAAIPGKLPGCGVSNPVRVTSVSGVTLSQPAVIDCPTAKALNTWVKTGVQPAVGRLGGGLSGLKIVAHYSCRTRNNQPGGRISEHGKGHAVDVAGVTLQNGVTLSVLNGWRDPVQGKVLKAIHKSACGPFGTVLGPNADRYHQDHLHVDTARYRSGSYCR